MVKKQWTYERFDKASNEIKNKVCLKKTQHELSKIRMNKTRKEQRQACS